MEFCILASLNKQVVDLSEDLARKVEDSFRQQEEISSLLTQIVDLQARCKVVRGTHSHAHTQRIFYTITDFNFFSVHQLTHENEELNQNLRASREGLMNLKLEARRFYSRCKFVLMCCLSLFVLSK